MFLTLFFWVTVICTVLTHLPELAIWMQRALLRSDDDMVHVLCQIPAAKGIEVSALMRYVTDAVNNGSAGAVCSLTQLPSAAE